jgi:hypothetical protein
VVERLPSLKVLVFLKTCPTCTLLSGTVIAVHIGILVAVGIKVGMLVINALKILRKISLLVVIKVGKNCLMSASLIGAEFAISSGDMCALLIGIKCGILSSSAAVILCFIAKAPRIKVGLLLIMALRIVGKLFPSKGI